MRKVLFAVPVLVAVLRGGAVRRRYGRCGGRCRVGRGGSCPRRSIRRKATPVRAALRSPGGGVYDLVFPEGGGQFFTMHLTVTVTANAVGGPMVAFSSQEQHRVRHEHLRQGWQHGQPVPRIRPPGALSDSLLHARVNPNGNQGPTGVKHYGLSHLCIFADKHSS